MLRKLCVFLSVLSCLLSNTCAYAKIPFIKPCKTGDHDCLLAANIQIAFPYLADGISELGIMPIEPMHLKNVTIDTGFLKLTFPDMETVGTRKCKIVDVKRNIQESTLNMTLDCPLKATGIYKLTGKICFFNVNDEGNFKLETDSIRTTITAKINEINGKDGKRYLKLQNYEYSFEPVESMHFELANLFAGDLGKAQPLLDFLNNDWKSIIVQHGEPIAKAAVKTFYNIFKNFFLRFPIEQLE